MGPLTDKLFWGDILENTKNVSKGLLSATVGAPADIATMLMRPFGYNVPDKKVVGSTEWFGGLLGADTESTPFKVATLLPTDAGDLMRYGGLLGTFAGVNAKTANKALLEAAEKMDKAGVDRTRIWQDTGWFKGPEGKWRFEIDDSATKFFSPPDSVAVPMKDVLKHEELASAYPSIEKTWFLSDPHLPQGAGQYYPPAKPDARGTISVYTNANYLPPATDPQKSVALHELQHVVQAREGFARGGSSSEFAGEKTKSALEELAARHTAGLPPLSAEAQAIRDRLFDSLSKDEAMGYPQKLYRRLAGEAEARAVQSRMNLSQTERRAKAPWESYDVPWDQLIVRGQDGGGLLAASSKPTYGGAHRPMTIEGGAAAAHDLTATFGKDIYGPKALQYFGSGDPREQSVLRVLTQIRGKPDAEVTIYRGIPKGAKGEFNAGDWVTLDKSVAADYGEQVIAKKVKAKDITSWADSLLEFGYYPGK